jgi:hypothetical protein
MSKPTQRDLLTAALLARGYEVDRSAKTTKYVVFRPTAGARILLKSSEDDLRHRVFAGKMGALRFSDRGTVTSSVPFSDRTINRLLEEGRSCVAQS